jgi:hypothetical protein
MRIEKGESVGKMIQGTENKLHLLVHLLVGPELILLYCILKHPQ